MPPLPHSMIFFKTPKSKPIPLWGALQLKMKPPQLKKMNPPSWKKNSGKLETAINTSVSLIKHWEKLAEIAQKHDFLT